MARDSTNVLLVLVGAALVKITADGTYLRYVQASSGPLVVAAGAVLIVLAVIALARDALGAVPVDDHQHGARSVWLLLVPVLTIFLIAPPALGADTVLRAGDRAAATIADHDASTFPPLPRVAVVPMSMSDFVVRSVWDTSRSLAGRTVALTGFVVHGNGSDYVARLVITCCAADATPMKVALTGTWAARLPDNQWVRVVGRLRPGSATEANGYTPTLTVTSLSTVAEPADPYEH